MGVCSEKRDRAATRWGRSCTITAFLLPVVVFSSACGRIGFDLLEPTNGPVGLDGSAGPGLPGANGTDGTLPGPSAWLANATHRRTVAVSVGQVEGSHTNFPLLVQLAADADLAANAAADGSDVFFTDGVGNPLDYEIELFNAATGSLAAWVRLPVLNNTQGGDVQMYYGGAAVTSPGSVWENAYEGVWHLGESSSQIWDSGSQSSHGTAQGSVSSTTGILGRGRQFAAGESWLQLGDGSLAPNEPFTMQLWVRPDASWNYWVGLMTKGRNDPAYQDWMGIWSRPVNQLTFGWGWEPPRNSNVSSSSTLTPGQWHCLTITFDGTTKRLYHNGQLAVGENTEADVSLLTTSYPTLVGTDGDNGNYFSGTMDEIPDLPWRQEPRAHRHRVCQSIERWQFHPDRSVRNKAIGRTPALSCGRS